MANLFDICTQNPDTYLCIKDYNENTHEATLLSVHPTSFLMEVKKLAKEGYTIIYSTPRGGYIVVNDFDSEFVVGQVYVRFNVLSHFRDRYVHMFTKEEGDYLHDPIIFMGATSSEEAEAYFKLLIANKATCERRWTTPTGGICLWF